MAAKKVRLFGRTEAKFFMTDVFFGYLGRHVAYVVHVGSARHKCIE